MPNMYMLIMSNNFTRRYGKFSTMLCSVISVCHGETMQNQNPHVIPSNSKQVPNPSKSNDIALNG
ncbi:hypothetical protein HYC85_004089 [Camellia sinensis]|uniref:Uncharacterized protein n=1 Tax=Camellia sinensis TaxID=4442 RepID=A0A7J7HXN1_CAMSI|nr:hypothetical protein HYC85_004089 [Camellia sinensis]